MASAPSSSDYDPAGRPLRRIGDGEIAPECIQNYAKLFPGRTSLPRHSQREQRGFGTDLGYQFNNDVS